MIGFWEILIILAIVMVIGIVAAIAIRSRRM